MRIGTANGGRGRGLGHAWLASGLALLRLVTASSSHGGSSRGRGSWASQGQLEERRGLGMGYGGAVAGGDGTMTFGHGGLQGGRGVYGREARVAAMAWEARASLDARGQVVGGRMADGRAHCVRQSALAACQVRGHHYGHWVPW